MIEKYLPYAASYTAAMSAANATPAKIFRSLAMNKDIYGDVADDAAMIYRDITLLGYDLITAMKTPSLIRAIDADLEAGHAAVIQIVSTGEALMERRLAEIPTEDWNDVQVDITPREYVLSGAPDNT